MFRDARFPVGPSALASALNSGGSILNTTGPAVRDLAGRQLQDRGDQSGAQLRSRIEWAVTRTGVPLLPSACGLRPNRPDCGGGLGTGRLPGVHAGPGSNMVWAGSAPAGASSETYGGSRTRNLFIFDRIPVV
jgi:hypothetical protein